MNVSPSEIPGALVAEKIEVEGATFAEWSRENPTKNNSNQVPFILWHGFFLKEPSGIDSDFMKLTSNTLPTSPRSTSSLARHYKDKQGRQDSLFFVQIQLQGKQL